MPKISVIVPVYNVEKYLNRCVESILNQTFKDFELILIDDGSPDNCPAICDEYAAKYDFIHVIHKQNGGQGEARNIGIDWAFENSDSEYIAFIDSDDWVHKRYFELLYKTICEYELTICCCKSIEINKTIHDVEINAYKTYIASPEELFLKFFLNISTPCMGLYYKYLFKDKRFPIGKFHEDEFIMPQILYSCYKIGFVDLGLYYYFYNPISTTHREKSPKWIDDQLEGIITQIDFLSKTEFEDTLNARMKRFKALVSTYYRDYGALKEYKKILSNRIYQAKKIITQNEHKIKCYDTKKYSFNKWVIGVPEKMKDLKKDKQTVKAEKGALYAFLWGVFNYIKIKLLMRI